ncbi:MAG: hypothetical protein MRJ96_08450 [Nitrospirales bacterium]|nr:hypothetical protein [Nitrospira sp.]MDR4501463.1 hypothetical protein [Nitrospirales bacterium]
MRLTPLPLEGVLETLCVSESNLAQADGEKGRATVRLESGNLRKAELHWYEAHGIGKRKMKIKRFLD